MRVASRGPDRIRKGSPRAWSRPTCFTASTTSQPGTSGMPRSVITRSYGPSRSRTLAMPSRPEPASVTEVGGAAQHVADGRPHRLVIVDEQHLRPIRLRDGEWRGRTLARRRQAQHHRRAAALLAVDRGVAAVAGHHAVHHREPETQTGLTLGREERLECAAAHRFRHAEPGVGHRHGARPPSRPVRIVIVPPRGIASTAL